jgi:hypothetical protein
MTVHQDHRFHEINDFEEVDHRREERVEIDH